jgi:hypothetical protein
MTIPLLHLDDAKKVTKIGIGGKLFDRRICTVGLRASSVRILVAL